MKSTSCSLQQVVAMIKARRHAHKLDQQAHPCYADICQYQIDEDDAILRAVKEMR